MRHGLTWRLALAAARIVPRLSLESAQRIGGFLGRTVFTLARARGRRIDDHLALAMPEATPQERARIKRESLEASGHVAMEALWIPAWDNARDAGRVTLQTPEAFAQCIGVAKARGRGLVLISAHLGCWEVLGRWFLSQMDLPVMGVAAEPRIAELTEPLRRLRESAGIKLVWRGEAGLPAMRHLRSGGCLVLLGDHNLKGEGIDAPFFGRPAHTLLAPARLAVRSGATVATMFCYRDGIGRVVVHADPPIDPTPRAGESKADAEVRLTLEYTARIEAAIRRQPGQWLWMHRRWQERG